MIEFISRPKLAKGWSYVLQTSQLAEALEVGGIDWQVSLNYWTPKVTGSILECHFWPPSSTILYPRFYIRAGAVPSTLRAAAQEALRELGLPQFIHWAKSFLALPEGSPRLTTEAYFDVSYTAEGLKITETPEFKSRVANPK